MTERRDFFKGLGAVVAASVVSRVGAASLPEAPTIRHAATQGPLPPPTGRPYNPVVTLSGSTLP